jgi:hypothetical protein
MSLREPEPVRKVDGLSLIFIDFYISENMILFAVCMSMLSESPSTVIIISASVKEDERGGQGHTSASLLYRSAT